MLKKLINRLSFLMLTFIMGLTSNTFSQSREFQVLSYNIKHGFEGDSTTIAEYIKWINKINPDIALYQEANGFNQKKMQELAKKYGHSYVVVMNQESGHEVTHPLAITSRYPINNTEMFLDSMWHGYIHARVQGIDLFVTHLAPFTLKDRQKDIQRIIEHTKKLPKASKILVAGDFNSLSRVDAAMYDDVLLTSMRKIEGRLEPKSGTPIVKNRIIYRNNLNNGQIDYSVTDMMLNAGFIDSYYELNKHFKNSVPAKSYQKKSSKLRRIDFVWVNSNLSNSLLKADIIHDKYTDFMSDHYPVLITLKKE
ncbi:endonuclease/exonuclease/phosphatase family protein [Pseudopedobacter beijingensis]|uniref:Endonuclease/exonuclease/phosphatase family protein n=1 Tax=Pseudopedobacter beijingensis TaxID=1207056 RepID=A0ABW4ID01_9SPHI